MIFAFEDSGRFESGQPPLARAIVSLRYPIVAAFSTMPAIEPIQRVLAKEFPELRAGQLNQFQLTVNASPSGTATSQQQQTPMPIWIFGGGSSEYQIIVSPSFTEISVGQAYKSREQFSEMLALACDALLSAEGALATCESVTVRYINAAPIANGWETWFRPEVVGWIGSPDVHAKQKYSISQTVLNDAAVDIPDTDRAIAANAIIRHGLVQGVGVDIVPQGQGESFIMDCEITLPTPQPFERDIILDVFRAYNHEIARFFDYALAESGRKRFEVRRKVEA
jgi:uncharacterized protein (TIGR04255 family)